MSHREEEMLSEPEIQRRWISKLVLGNAIQCMTNVMLLALLVVMYFQKPAAQFLAINNQLQVEELTTSEEYLASEEEVIAWMVTCSMQATSFSFDKYRREIETARRCFESAAWDEYFSKLEAADFDRVKRRKTNVSGTPTGYPLFVGEQLVDGNTVYEYEFPFVRTWESEQGLQNQSHLARAIIMPVSNKIKASGWQIIHFSLGAAP